MRACVPAYTELKHQERRPSGRLFAVRSNRATCYASRTPDNASERGIPHNMALASAGLQRHAAQMTDMQVFFAAWSETGRSAILGATPRIRDRKIVKRQREDTWTTEC